MLQRVQRLELGQTDVGSSRLMSRHGTAGKTDWIHPSSILPNETSRVLSRLQGCKGARAYQGVGSEAVQ